MLHHRFVAFFCMSLGLLGLGAGCSSSENEAPSGAAAIASFAAIPPTIDPGMSSILRWEVSGAARLELATKEGAVIELLPKDLEAGQVEVHPEQTTRYVLMAWGKDGVQLSREARVSVRTDVLRIVDFEAAPRAIRAGQAITLSWTTEHATALRLFAKDGAEVALGDASKAQGSVKVEPRRSTTYVLRASNERAVEEATVAVEVEAALDAELFVDRSKIDFGQETILRWRSRSASRIVIRSGEEVLIDSTTELSGSLAIAPQAATAYELTAHGDAGTATATVAVKVAPVIDRFTSVSSGPMAPGADVDLQWTVRGADAVRISSVGGWSFDADADALAEGSIIAPVPDDGSFLLEASLGGEKVSRALRFGVLDPPSVLAFEVSPAILTLAPGGTAQVRFSWTTALASSISVAREGGGVVVSRNDGADTGEAQVEIDGGGVFVLTASSAAGTASRAVEVRTFAPPAISSFGAWPVHVGVGEAFELAWETAAASIAIEVEGQILHRGAGGAGSLQTQLAASSTFRLVAANEAGDTVEQPLEVTVGRPSILSFVADRSRHGPGSTVRFSWATLGGTSLQLSGPDGVVCTTAARDEIPAGACAVLLPSTPGPLTYSLRLANGLGQTDVEAVTVEVVDGPAILDFYAAASRLTLGESTTFSWITGVDADGQPPSLELADGADVYSLGGADPSQGSATITPLRTGSRIFRLTASTPGTAPSSRELQLLVVEAPTLVVTPQSAIFEPGQGSVELGWQSTHAVELEVFEVDDLGVASSIASYVDPALVAVGGVQVQPPAPGRTYRFVATNDAGGTAIREIEVSWAAPRISEFSVSPSDIALRSPTEIQWITEGTSSVSIAPSPLVETEVFVERSLSPTAAELQLSDCGPAQLPADGCVDVNLPFSFPYDGQLHSQARVYLHGVIGFDRSHAGGAQPNVELPSSQAPFIALAPFWQQLRTSVPDATREGRIFLESATDDHGDYVAIQWAGFWAASSTAAQPVDLNFEVVLYASGDFDFRYGRMQGADQLQWVDGRQASIGYQSAGGTQGRSISFQQAIDGGLDGLAFGVRPATLPAIGSIRALPLSLGTFDYTLTASGGGGSSTASGSVTVHPPVTLDDVRLVEAFLEPHTPFTIAWTTTGASEVRVELPQVAPEDPVVVLCTVLPSQTQHCVLQEAVEGTYTYAVRAIGFGQMDEQVVEIDVTVLPPFSIDSFAATPSTVAPLEEVSLSWTTTNATSIALTANGVAVDVSALSPLTDSTTLEVEVDTTFVLTATSHGRTLSESRTVLVEEPEEPDAE